MSKAKTAAKTTKTENTGAIAPMTKFKVKKLITLPLLKMTIGDDYFVKLIGVKFKASAMKVDPNKAIDPKVEKEAKKDPPMLINVIDLTTGEPMQMILNSVLESNIDEAYPDDSYVNLGFKFIKHAKASGKDYNTFTIAEIELD